MQEAVTHPRRAGPPQGRHRRLQPRRRSRGFSVACRRKRRARNCENARASLRKRGRQGAGRGHGLRAARVPPRANRSRLDAPRRHSGGDDGVAQNGIANVRTAAPAFADRPTSRRGAAQQLSYAPGHRSGAGGTMRSRSPLARRSRSATTTPPTPRRCVSLATWSRRDDAV